MVKLCYQGRSSWWGMGTSRKGRQTSAVGHGCATKSPLTCHYRTCQSDKRMHEYPLRSGGVWSLVRLVANIPKELENNGVDFFWLLPGRRMTSTQL